MKDEQKNAQRNPEDFISDLKFFKSNKLSVNQSVAFFAGLSFELILNKKIFPRNADLEIFLNEVYLKHNKKPEDQTFKQYLYKSRTQLGARLTRNILDEFDYVIVKKISNDIEEILLAMFPEMIKSNTIKYNSSFSKGINSWINAISMSNKSEKETNNE